MKGEYVLGDRPKIIGDSCFPQRRRCLPKVDEAVDGNECDSDKGECARGIIIFIRDHASSSRNSAPVAYTGAREEALTKDRAGTDALLLSLGFLLRHCRTLRLLRVFLETLFTLFFLFLLPHELLLPLLAPVHSCTLCHNCLLTPRVMPVGDVDAIRGRCQRKKTAQHSGLRSRCNNTLHEASPKIPQAAGCGQITGSVISAP